MGVRAHVDIVLILRDDIIHSLWVVLYVPCSLVLRSYPAFHHFFVACGESLGLSTQAAQKARDYLHGALCHKKLAMYAWNTISLQEEECCCDRRLVLVA